MAEYIEKDDVSELCTQIIRDATRVIDLQVADVAPVKKGKWIEIEYYNGDVFYRCSICGDDFDLIEGDPKLNDYHYCPNCGAKMDGKVSEEGKNG